MLEDFDHSSLQNFLTKLRSCYRNLDLFLSVILRSLWMCQKHDAEEALKRGITLELDTPVEAEFTHGTSVQLHLDLLVLTKRETPKPMPLRKKCNKKQDKVNSADSAFIFLIIQSQNQWSGWSGRRRWSCLVWSLLER